MVKLPRYGHTRDRKTERQKDKITERQKDRKTERQKDRKTERQKDRKTERQKDRKTERQKSFIYFKRIFKKIAVKIVLFFLLGSVKSS